MIWLNLIENIIGKNEIFNLKFIIRNEIFEILNIYIEFY